MDFVDMFKSYDYSRNNEASAVTHYLSTTSLTQCENCLIPTRRKCSCDFYAQTKASRILVLFTSYIDDVKHCFDQKTFIDVIRSLASATKYVKIVQNGNEQN